MFWANRRSPREIISAMGWKIFLCGLVGHGELGFKMHNVVCLRCNVVVLENNRITGY